MPLTSAYCREMTNCTWAPLQNHWTSNDGVLKITLEQHWIREVQLRLSKRWPTCFGLFLSSFQSCNPSLWSNSKSLSNLQEVRCSSASVLLQSTLEGTFFDTWAQSGQGSSGGAVYFHVQWSFCYWAIDSTGENSFSFKCRTSSDSTGFHMVTRLLGWSILPRTKSGCVTVLHQISSKHTT